MKIILARFFGLLLVLSIASSASALETEYWVHGNMAETHIQENYLNQLGQIVSYYQDNYNLEIIVVSEEEAIRQKLADASATVVICGPVEAFEKLDYWQLSSLSIDENAVNIADLTIDNQLSGFYLESENRARRLYSGLSFEGFESIFTVPTGSDALTVVINGRIIWSGNYEDGSLAIKRKLFRPLVPAVNSLQYDKTLLSAIEAKPFSQSGTLDKIYEQMNDNKVLFIGESHWTVEIPQLRNKILFELAAKLPTKGVLLELPFSMGPFYSHYISLSDDNAAKRFLSDFLHQMVPDEATMELLKTLRLYNKKHPDSPLAIGCIDLEWRVLSRFNQIVEPVYKKWAGKETLDEFVDQINQGDMENLLKNYEKLLEKIPNDIDPVTVEGLGELQISPAWARLFIKNLIHTAMIDKGDDFNLVRQEAIIRNLSKKAAYGRWFEEGRVIIHGGSWHARKKPPAKEDSYWLEAAYLHHEHHQTKGKVVNLFIGALGYSLWPVKNIDFENYFPGATLYNQAVIDFNAAVSEGTAEEKGVYSLFHPLSDFEQLILAKGDSIGANIVLIESVDWNLLKNNMPESLDSEFAWNLSDFDHSIAVLRATIDRPRKKR